MNFTATSDNEAGADRLVSVEFLNLGSDLRRNLIDRWLYQIPDFVCRNRMRNTHNILIRYLTISRRSQLHRLRCLEINKEMLHDQLC